MHTFAFIRACQNRLIDFYNEELKNGDSGECPSREDEDPDSTMNKGMFYDLQQGSYGGGRFCLTAEEATRIKNDPNTVKITPVGIPCSK